MKRIKPTRNKNGTIRNWQGGTNKTWKGTRQKIGREFKKETGRKMKKGDVFRRKTSSGKYDGRSIWQIHTGKGIRPSPTGKRKPSKNEVRKIISRSRKGRGL